MLRFKSFLNLIEATLRSSGRKTKGHIEKYVTPSIANKTELELDSDYDQIKAGTKIVPQKVVNIRGKTHITTTIDGQRIKIPLHKIKKPPTIGNTQYANYYEALVAYHVHNSTGKPRSEELESSISKYREALGDNNFLKKKAERRAKFSAESWLSSLSKRGVRPEDIEEVKHTKLGISTFTGDSNHIRSRNPHDVTIRVNPTAQEKLGLAIPFYGASLKGGRETIGNNGASSIILNGNRILDDHSNQIKKNLNNKKQLGISLRAAANHHSSIFNSSEIEEKRKHLTALFRGEPDVPYDKVTASDTGANSSFHQDLDYIKNIRDATNFEMKRISRSPTLHVYATMKDGSRRRVGSLNHRVDSGIYRIDSNSLSGSTATPATPKRQQQKQRSKRSSASTDASGSVDYGHVVINPLQ